jgi:hypothetical protein
VETKERAKIKTCQAERPMIRNRRLLVCHLKAAKMSLTETKRVPDSLLAEQKKKGNEKRKKGLTLLSGTTGPSTKILNQTLAQEDSAMAPETKWVQIQGQFRVGSEEKKRPTFSHAASFCFFSLCA